MRLRYDIVDVFTDRPFAGNQLAVVHGAQDLSAGQCLVLTREFGFSESAFPGAAVVEGPDGPEYSVRIFTPGGEVPFAGHPTLGTAWVLRDQGMLAADRVTQVCGTGRIGVRFLESGVELSAVPRELTGPLEPGLVSSLLADLGLGDDDRDGEAWVAGCGLTFVHVPVSAGALGRACVSQRPLAEYAGRLSAQDPLEGVNLVHVSSSYSSSGAGLEVRARVFVPGLLVPEDAATGSAAAGLGVALVAGGWLREGGRFDITQGVEMGRPSRLLGRVDVAGDRAVLCHVAGAVQRVASGEIERPPHDSGG